MPFIRISLMVPKPGQDNRVDELLKELVQFYVSRPGFLAAYRLAPDPHAATKRVGRISVWREEVDAHRTASEARDLAIQSELKLVVEDETHHEFSFVGFAPGD